MKKLLSCSSPVYKVSLMRSTISRLPLRRLGIFLLALYLIAGGIYSFMLPPEARFSDEKEYLQLSDHLRHGPGYSIDGVHLTASRPPGYAFFISTIESIGGGITGIRLAQYVLLCATILL